MQHRANPIPETLEPVNGFPDVLKIYKIPASPRWYVRAHLGGKRVVKSTGTDDKAVARKFAKKFYNDLLLKQSQNLPLTQSSSFSMVALDLIKDEQNRADRGEISQRRVSDLKYMLAKDLLPFFSGTALKDINFQKIQKYVDYLKPRNLASSTLKLHFDKLKMILKHAYKMEMIDKMPIFPTITMEINPRGWFTEAEYKHLITVTKQEIEKKAVVRYVPLTNEILYLTEFLLLSFLRPTDIIHMRVGQITISQQDGFKVLMIYPTSKVDETYIMSMPECVPIYEALLASHEGKNGKDDYVFFPRFENRTYMKETARRQFTHCLVAAKMKKALNGDERTLYSLRHTRIMLTLLHNKDIDLKTLADNCRTSIKMLEDYYLSHLTNQMNVHKIVGIPKKGKKAKRTHQRMNKYLQMFKDSITDEATKDEDELHPHDFS